MSKTSVGQACISKVYNNGEQRATEAAKKISFDFKKRFCFWKSKLIFHLGDDISEGK